jgi:hypothetical protein
MARYEGIFGGLSGNVVPRENWPKKMRFARLPSLKLTIGVSRRRLYNVGDTFHDALGWVRGLFGAAGRGAFAMDFILAVDAFALGGSGVTRCALDHTERPETIKPARDW